jgi:hypothetical protein
LLAGRKLITLTASLPNVMNTTTITPRIFTDTGPTFVVCGQNQSVIEESLIEIGEVQAVFVKVR